MKKNIEINETTKKNIVNAFWELYKEISIDKISIQKNMSNAGYHRSTFYLYFTNIYELLDCLEDSIINEIKEKTSSIPEITIIDIGEELIRKISNIYLEYEEYMYILLGENGDSKFINKIKATLKLMFYSHVTIKDNESNVHLDLLFEFMTSALLGVLQYYYKHKGQIKIEEAFMKHVLS